MSLDLRQMALSAPFQKCFTLGTVHCVKCLHHKTVKSEDFLVKLPQKKQLHIISCPDLPWPEQHTSAGEGSAAEELLPSQRVG